MRNLKIILLITVIAAVVFISRRVEFGNYETYVTCHVLNKYKLKLTLLYI